MSYNRHRGDKRIAITEGQRDHEDFCAQQEEDMQRREQRAREAAEHTLRYELQEEDARDIQALKTLKERCLYRTVPVLPQDLSALAVIELIGPSIPSFDSNDARRVLCRYENWRNEETDEPKLGKVPKEFQLVDIHE